ncbi:recombinase family protein [Peribacillus frigoritolerans]
MINNIIIEVYTSMAEQERETIKQRQAEGIAVAKTKGKHLGRPLLELPLRNGISCTNNGKLVK